jgi:hypothetical protein
VQLSAAIVRLTIARVIPNFLPFIPFPFFSEIISMCLLTEIYCVPQSQMVRSRFHKQKALQPSTNISNIAGP